MKLPKKKNRPGSVGKVAGVVAAASIELACPGGQVRPPPQPEECPPGALKAMKERGIKVGNTYPATFPVVWDAQFITVPEGQVSIHLYKPWQQLPPDTTFSGRLIFGPDRVYGRLTEARTPEGERFPVCLELFDERTRKRGLERKPDEGPDTARVFSTVLVGATDHFE